MKIYDISQEVFGCKVYPGDPTPQKQQISSMEKGDLYNLTAFSMCAHNGTHIDAPLHFINEGKGIDKLPLEHLVGMCYVTEFNGEMTKTDAERIYQSILSQNPESSKRLLFKGDAVITESAAEFFITKEIFLIGVESQTVGPENAPMKTHLLLLGKEIILLEGLRMQSVTNGVYLLNAAPLNLGNSDGAPCRAILIEI